jgi:YidC/Oxa1 family membrane protein insertase
MQDRSPSSFPLANFLLFVVLSFLILVGYSLLMAYLRPPPRQAAGGPEAAKQEQAKAGPQAGPQGQAKAEAKPAAKPGPQDHQPAAKEEPVVKEEPAAKGKPAAKEKPAAKGKPAELVPAAAGPAIPPQWVALGSADPADPYRMLVTLSNRGAALARIELSSSRYCDLEDRSGYLGHLVMDDDGSGKGCPVQVVGPGTPAAKAGLRPGDLITAVNEQMVRNELALEKVLAGTEPGQEVTLEVLRGGKRLSLPPVRLTRRPLEVVRPEPATPEIFLTGKRVFDRVHPEDDSPLGMLVTLQQVDADKIPPDADPADIELGRELAGVDLRTGCWEVVESDQQHAVFRRKLPRRGLEITKTYRLAEVPAEAWAAADAQAYHLEFELRIKNIAGKAHDVAYRLDGPNGLPHEGAWYAYKVSGGLRDIAFQTAQDSNQQINCAVLATEGSHAMAEDRPFRFLAVDAQYFAAALIPDEKVGAVERAVALRIGNADPQRPAITNTSFRILSHPETLQPGQELAHSYKLFAGPKRPGLLKPYDLDKLIYFGWYPWVAEPMTAILEFFHDHVVFNYGLAIIMLTVVVRLALFPLSRKQALGARKMQELQPEIKKIQERYKKDLEGRTKAQQELFRKHNYNPLSGCLVLFIQLPIMVGLYRSLQVDVELRDASLLGHAVRWCSNLAGPDMLYDWSAFMPDAITSGIGMFGLGPYFNLLPMLTIVLFIVQQKMLMPPPADESAAVQQKVMNFMMIFMGILFYKVASGLCIYFIASSLWGLAERKFLPKTAKASSGNGDAPAGRLGRLFAGSRDGDAAARRKRRGKR